MKTYDRKGAKGLNFKENMPYVHIGKERYAHIADVIREQGLEAAITAYSSNRTLGSWPAVQHLIKGCLHVMTALHERTTGTPLPGLDTPLLIHAPQLALMENESSEWIARQNIILHQKLLRIADWEDSPLKGDTEQLLEIIQSITEHFSTHLPNHTYRNLPEDTCHNVLLFVASCAACVFELTEGSPRTEIDVEDYLDGMVAECVHKASTFTVLCARYAEKIVRPLFEEADEEGAEFRNSGAGPETAPPQ